MAFLSNDGTDEGVGIGPRIVSVRAAAGVGPRRLREWGRLVPRRHHHGRAFAAHPARIEGRETAVSEMVIVLCQAVGTGMTRRHRGDNKVRRQTILDFVFFLGFLF